MMRSTLRFLVLGIPFLLGACAHEAAARAPLADAATESGTIESLFTPGDKIAKRIVSAIGEAKKDIKIQAYGFTNTAIAKALAAAAQRGVAVQLIEDDGEYANLNGFTKLKLDGIKAAGAKIYIDGDHAIAHNKVMIIDAKDSKPVVITGSYNFTQAAENNNAENVLLISGNGALAASYLANWQKHLSHSTLLP